MVFNANFNNISVISSRSVLFVKETIWTFYGKFADMGDNPVNNTNIYNIERDNRLSPGLQPLTTESMLKILFFFTPVPQMYFLKQEIIFLLSSTEQKVQALPVSLDCPFFIASSIFSTVYLNILEQFRYNKTYIAFISGEHQVVNPREVVLQQ